MNDDTTKTHTPSEAHEQATRRASDEPRAPEAATSYWRWLLHRWLVEYNPLYLLSATLVLGGMILTSRGLAREGSLYGELGVAAIAELYAATLIGGAALLTRIGHRRPAVMLALLTVLYQCDLTLHTETCAYLGQVGTWATAAWLVLFVVKLRALAWAMRVRLSRSGFAMAGLGALGLAALPACIQHLPAQRAGAVVALWLFALASLHQTGNVQSLVPLDPWGDVVLRRAQRAAWLLSAALVLLHVLFWSTQRPIALAALLPVAPLLLVRRVRTEARAWGLVGSALLVVATTLPAAFALAALLAALALATRALLHDPEASLAQPPEAIRQPYRAASSGTAPIDLEPGSAARVTVERAERMRLLMGAVFAAYLGVWTLGWSSGPWPAHVLSLDLVVTAVVLLGVWKTRVRAALAPLAASYVHHLVQAHLIPAPRSLVEWGSTAVVLGFALLVASLSASYRLRAR